MFHSGWQQNVSYHFLFCIPREWSDDDKKKKKMRVNYYYEYVQLGDLQSSWLTVVGVTADEASKYCNGICAALIGWNCFSERKLKWCCASDMEICFDKRRLWAPVTTFYSKYE